MTKVDTGKHHLAAYTARCNASQGAAPAIGSPAMKPSLNRLIERTFFSGLVFNQSWEDPTLDREALRIRPDVDTVLSITSGGCNCLNLLCLRPGRLICVDANPAQTHLLRLKLAGIRYLDHADFFALFGSSGDPRAVPLYQRVLRDRLPADTRGYWDRNVRLLARGVLTQGTLGVFLRWFRRYLRWQVGEAPLRRLLATRSLAEQRQVYHEAIRPRLWRGPLPSVLGLRPVLALAGMHPSQYALIRAGGGLRRYARDRIEYLLTEVPVQDNYFVAQAALGTYLDAWHVPPYLLDRNFATLKQLAGRVQTVTARLADHLRTLPDATIDRFNLLDIFDWMDPGTRQATFGEVVRVGSDGARLIYRSTVSSLPAPVAYHGVAVGEDDLARELFAQDRSGTYSSFYVYRLDKTRAAR